MILFTGNGAFYNAFQKENACGYVSLRRSDDATLRAALKNAKVVVHNAANIQCADVEEAVRDNFLPTLRLVSLCEETNPAVKFVHIGSMSYLASEKAYLPVEEMSPYAYSKYLAETYCLKSALPNVCSVRFSTLFYQDPKKDGLSKLIADAVEHRSITIYNGGTARRDFLPLDVAVAYTAKLIGQVSGKSAVTLAAGRSVSFGEIARHLQGCIPDLKVNDLPAVFNGREVLSDFSGEDIRRLGEIPFSLEAEMEKYLRSLQPVTA